LQRLQRQGATYPSHGLELGGARKASILILMNVRRVLRSVVRACSRTAAAPKGLAAKTSAASFKQGGIVSFVSRLCGDRFGHG
jgi:hypothetical protein